LVNLSADSLAGFFANRTDAQAEKLIEQHLGKPVRVSGAVEKVALGRIPNVKIKGNVGLFLFFDRDEGYDPDSVLLALNAGDEIAAEGRIWRMSETTVTLDHCKLVDARGPAAGGSL
jgi:hypothetical protein